MKPEEYEGNTQYMRYEYHRVREGPNYFVSYYKNSSRLHYDPKDTWRTLGTAKFTDTGKSLKEWCLLMDETHGVPQRERWSDSTDGVSEANGSYLVELVVALTPIAGKKATPLSYFKYRSQRNCRNWSSYSGSS